MKRTLLTHIPSLGLAVLFLGLAGALLIGFNLLVATLLDHPFSGDVAISSNPFRVGALSRFWP